ncbi:MAG: molybdopterin-binding protein [Suipraeoptans sp.]
MGTILGICISDQRGIQKSEVKDAYIEEGFGIRGDAHGGKWHRQISLLSFEKIEDFRARGADVPFGAFGENLIIEGYDLGKIPVGSRMQVGKAVIEITQIGKDCHNHCKIYEKMNDCIMPREGIFAEVITGGEIHVGDEVTLLSISDKRFSAAVITLSDKGFRGEREDISGPTIKNLLEENGYKVIETLLLSDDRESLEKSMCRLADQRQVNLILTTGGTGFSDRDNTPEATMSVCDKMANGIAEAIRAYSMTITHRAMFSRGVSGLRNKTLIINLPGSPKAVRETLEYILPELPHGLGILKGTQDECGGV